MDTSIKGKSKTNSSVSSKQRKNSPDDLPRSKRFAKQGITTGNQFAAFMSALMLDTVDGRLSASTVNAACNAGGKLLKAVELQHKYGRASRHLNDIKLIRE